MIIEIDDHTSALYNVASNSLSTSVNWLQELIRFMDDTYKEYSEAGFSPKKAWHITTRRSRTLLCHISEPRTGVVRALQTKRPLQMKQAIFFSTIKSLETMKQLTHVGFKNCNLVGNELVKFLAKNTNADVMETLKKDLKELKDEYQKGQREWKEAKEALGKIRKTAEEAQKTASGFNNRISTNTNSIKDLKDRVQKLE